MSDQDDTQESHDSLRAELDAIQPDAAASDRVSNKARINAAMADTLARAAKQLEHDKAVSREAKMSIARAKYCPKYGWTDAEFAVNWKLRDIPAPDKSAVGFSVRKSMWDLLLDRERKRLKAKPRTNKDLSGATPEEKGARKRMQDTKAQQRRRARIAAEADIQAVTDGKRPLTDEELSAIEAAERG